MGLVFPSRPRRGRCREESINSLPIGFAFSTWVKDYAVVLDL